jgi:aarF domain-containing kinase
MPRRYVDHWCAGQSCWLGMRHTHARSLSLSPLPVPPLLFLLVPQLFPEFQFTWLVDQINENLPNELDFVKEAKNSERAARNFASNSNLKIPYINWVCTHVAQAFAIAH